MTITFEPGTSSIKRPLVKKASYRYFAYLIRLLRTDVLFGGRARRQFFMKRLGGRIATRLNLYPVPKAIYFGFLYVASFVAGSHGKHAWGFRHWYWATTGLSNQKRLREWTQYPASKGPLRILVLGTGSLGDVIQITPVFRALKEAAPDATIILLHRSLIAQRILASNPYIASISTADFYTFQQIKEGVMREAAADLVLEIESVTYLARYTRAPADLERPIVTKTFPESFFTQAAAALGLWQTPRPKSLTPNETSHWPTKWQGWHFLDVLGSTSGLKIDKHSQLDFPLPPSNQVDVLTFDGAYVTVQNGVDADVMNWARATGQRPTKLLPLVTLEALVNELKYKNIKVVQIGGEDDEAIENVDLDLRGRTSLTEVGIILRRALCHVGSEGGLVHLARAVGAKSVVLFGPTAVDFFGYAENLNLAVGDCSSCWRRTRDWYIYCPRGLKSAACMEEHRGSVIAEAVFDFIQNDKRGSKQLEIKAF